MKKSRRKGSHVIETRSKYDYCYNFRHFWGLDRLRLGRARFCRRKYIFLENRVHRRKYRQFKRLQGRR